MSEERIVPSLLRLGRRIRARIFQLPVEREVDDEFEFHVRMRMEEHLRRGLSRDEARRAALEGFGDVERVKAECREIGERRERKMRRRGWVEELWQDVRFGVRQLRRNRGFAAVALATLAVAIGANTAVYSVVSGVLLRPLPYEEPEELVAVWTRYLPRSGFDIPQFPLSGPELLDYREQTEVMEAVAAYNTTTLSLRGDGSAAVRLRAARLSADVLPLLGVPAAHGRWFGDAEDQPGAAPSAILSHGLWRDRFGGDPSIVGGTVTVDGRATRVVGVMPAGFVFPSSSIELWVPLELNEQSPGGRASHWLLGVGRLAPGRTLAEAGAELEAITARWNEEYQHHAMGHFVFVRDLHEELVGAARTPLLLLLAAVAIVLLVASANLANLMLARAEHRQRELSVRVALGAGRGRLVRQLLTEGLVLALVGAVLGLVLGQLGTRWLVAMDPAALPRLEGIGVDGGVLAFTAGVTVLTALLFGLVPALNAGRQRLTLSAAETRGTAAAGRARFRRSLVVAEVALSLVVVVAAGLVVRSFWQLRQVDPGVRTERLLTFGMSLPSASYPEPERVVRSADALLDRIRNLPGVEAASAVSALPLTGTPPRQDFQRPGGLTENASGQRFNADIAYVHPGYFETMGIPITRGRSIRDTDRADGRPVAVINEEMARVFWPGEDPIGRRFGYFIGGDSVPWITIVGVAGNTKAAELDEQDRALLYLPHDQLRAAQGSTGRNLTFVVRTTQPPNTLVPSVRAAVGELAPDVPLFNVRSMDDVVSASFADVRLTTSLLAAFALIALLLATVGIYGVVSYSVARRTREIGIRVALGADRGVVTRMVLRQGAAPAVLGVGLGLVAAYWATALFRGLLFNVSPTDPAVFVALAGLLLAVSAVASWIPARRATRIPPTRALRNE